MNHSFEFQYSRERIIALDQNHTLICEATFCDNGSSVNIDHVYVSEEYRGQGVAGKLLQAATEHFSKGERTVFATCSYARRWLEEHPCDEDKLKKSEE